MEVEKLLKASFIYHVPLTDWVSNIVPVTKKQGTIRICIDYRDINRACPKYNYPTPFVDQIIDDCASSEIFSFMDGFSSYNKINILPLNQHKTAFICPWVPFPIKNSLLDSKMLAQLFSGLCLTLFMILSILYNPILMTYLHIPCNVRIILHIFELFFLDVIFTIFA
jgi:hypothetical protein